MRKIIFSFALLYTVTLCSFTSPVFQVVKSNGIYGQVIDQNTKAVIPNAQVFIGDKLGFSIRTNELGEFSFIDLDAGNYFLSAASDHYLTDFVKVNIGNGEVVKVDIEMENDKLLNID